MYGVEFVVSDDYQGFKLAGWEVLPEAVRQGCRVEENIGETFNYQRLHLQHYKHIKSANMLERFDEEIKRRTHGVRIFPYAASFLRLVRALAVETHESRLEACPYLIWIY